MNYIKSELLAAVESEQENAVRNKVCDTLSVLAGCMLADDVAWPELIPKLFVWAGTAGPGRKAALSTLATVAEYVGRGLFQGQFVQQVKDVLSVSITPDNTMEVRETAVRASAKFVSLLESSQEREFFTPLLGPMLAVVSDALNAQDELVARHTVELLIEVAECDNVSFFKPAIDQERQLPHPEPVCRPNSLFGSPFPHTHAYTHASVVPLTPRYGRFSAP